MGRQNRTGNQTEALVQAKFHLLGLHTRKPIPDLGVDLEVSCPGVTNIMIRIQIKGRGKFQRNNRYRWFQIRTTTRQREKAHEEGLAPQESWRVKARLVEFFVFVSEYHEECWVFNSMDVEEIVKANRQKYGQREDNRNGKQAELDLDVVYEGQPLTEKFKASKEGWNKILGALGLPENFVTPEGTAAGRS